MNEQQARRGPQCSVCASEQRWEVEAALIEGATFLNISRRFAPLDRHAIRRHAVGHMGERDRAAIADARGLRPADFALRVLDIARRAREVAEQAEADGHSQTVLKAGREELHALAVLAGMGLRSETLLAQYDAFRSVSNAVMFTAKHDPEAVAVIVAELERRDHADLAAELREQFPETKELSA